MQPFTYHQPVTSEEACNLLARFGDDAKPYAGGTSLLALMKQGIFHADHLVDLKHIDELHAIELEDDASITIGALVTHRTLELSPLIREHLPILAEVEYDLANVRVRIAGTIGGSLSFAEPQSDPPTVLGALGASVRLLSSRGERWISLAEFYVDYYETAAEPDELLTHVRVPAAPSGSGMAYVKFCNRTRSDKPTVGSMVAMDANGGASVWLAAVGPTPIRALEAEACLRDQGCTDAGIEVAAAAAREAAEPIDDLYGSASYKRAMVEVMTRRAIIQAMQRAGTR